MSCGRVFYEEIYLFAGGLGVESVWCNNCWLIGRKSGGQCELCVELEHFCQLHAYALIVA